MQIIILLLSAILCYFLSALIHELGHIIWGIIHHWKLFLLVVGPFKLYREEINAKLKVGIETNMLLWCGVGGTIPRHLSAENLKIWGQILLAGPITSILFGLLMIPFYIRTEHIIVLMLAIMPIAMGIMCILPMNIKTGILYNDGTRYFRLKKNGQEALEEKALYQLTETQLIYGENATFSREMILPLLHSKDKEIQYYGHYYMYQLAKTESNTEEMMIHTSHMQSLKNHVSKVILNDCKL